MIHPGLNFLLYQAGWFACVLGGARGHPWTGAAVALLLTGGHLALAANRDRELELILTAGTIGFIAESVLQSAGLLRYPSSHGIVPIWIVALWGQFATTLRSSLRWLLGRPVWAAGLGVVGGPLAFRAGEALGAVQFSANRVASYLALSLVWGVALPFLVSRAGRPIA